MSEDIQNAYPSEPWFITIKYFRRMILLTAFFHSYSWLLPAPQYEKLKGYEENVTSPDTAFEVYKLHKTHNSSQPPFDLLSGLLSKVLHFMFYYAGYCMPILLTVAMFYSYCYRIVFMKNRIQIIADFCHIDFHFISEINIDRSQHLREKSREMFEEERTLKSKLLLETPAVCRYLSHPDLITSALVTASDYTSLQSVYSSSWTKNFFDFADMVVFLRQMLNAVQYLHEQNIYHLNLQTKNIWVRKSIWRFRRTAKIGGFDFAIRNEGTTFYFDKVGLPSVFRPPEYSAGTEMDAAKFDCWSLGVVAFEAFTGGMLSVESGLMKPPVLNGQELIQPRGLLTQSYFISAVLSSWKILRNFYIAHLNNYINVTLLYDLYYDGVLLDCIKFVRCLLYHDYELRYNILDALEMPLMRKATGKRKTSKLNLFRYM